MTQVYLVAAVLLLGSLCVILPRFWDAYTSYRQPRKVRCPKEGARAEILVDAWRAAATQSFGKPRFKIRHCSYWPYHSGCPESCLENL